MNDAAPMAEAGTWLGRFADAFAGHDVVAALSLFTDDYYWRDLVAFTWNVKTLEGKSQIAAMLGRNGMRRTDFLKTRQNQASFVVEQARFAKPWIAIDQAQQLLLQFRRGLFPEVGDQANYIALTALLACASEILPAATLSASLSPLSLSASC